MKYRRLRSLIVALSLSCIMPIMTYANDVDINSGPGAVDVTETLENNQVTENYDKDTYNWVEYDKKWKYVNGFGEVAYGLFTDERGEIYYGGLDGFIYQNKADENGQYFGNDGKLVNLGAHLINNDEANQYADILDSGNTLTVDDFYDVNGFLEYYLGQDYIYIQPAAVTINKRQSGKVKLKLYNTPSYNREDVEKAIDELYDGKELLGDNIKNKIIYAAIILKEHTMYDDSYVSTDIITCINDRRACCRHYACIFSYILNKNGIYAEEVAGESGGPHSWIRAYYDDKWHYIDISAYIETFDVAFLDMDYQFYLDNYTVKSRVATR